MRLMAYFKLRRVVAIIWCFVCFRLSFFGRLLLHGKVAMCKTVLSLKFQISNQAADEML